MRNKTILKHLPPTPPFFPGSTLTLFLYLLPPTPSSTGRWGTGVAVSSSHVVSAAPSSSGRTPHTLPLLQHEVPVTGDSSPQTSPT